MNPNLQAQPANTEALHNHKHWTTSPAFWERPSALRASPFGHQHSSLPWQVVDTAFVPWLLERGSHCCWQGLGYHWPAENSSCYWKHKRQVDPSRHPHPNQLQIGLHKYSLQQPRQRGSSLQAAPENPPMPLGGVDSIECPCSCPAKYPNDRLHSNLPRPVGNALVPCQLCFRISLFRDLSRGLGKECKTRSQTSLQLARYTLQSQNPIKNQTRRRISRKQRRQLNKRNVWAV